MLRYYSDWGHKSTMDKIFEISFLGDFSSSLSLCCSPPLLASSQVALSFLEDLLFLASQIAVQLFNVLPAQTEHFVARLQNLSRYFVADAPTKFLFLSSSHQSFLGLL